MDSSGTKVWSRSGSVGLLQHRRYIAAGRGWTVRGTVGRRHGAVYTARCWRIDVRQRSSLRRRPRRAHAETERARPNLCPNPVRTGLPSLSPIPVTSPNLCSNPGSNWTPKSAKSDSRKKSESISESLSESGSESGSELDSQVPPSPIPETSPNLCPYPVRSPKSPESEPRRADVVAGRYGLAC